jgi:hypothetical protein
MSTQAPQNWFEANQARLVVALDKVRAALERHAARVGSQGREDTGIVTNKLSEAGGPPVVEQPIPEPNTGEHFPSFALDYVCKVFALSAFERDLLLLCAGMELDSRFPTLCAAAHGDPRRAYPTFSLALAALDEPHWSAIVPTGHLRFWRLVELRPADTLAMSPLCIDERVLHYLVGLSYLDERLREFVEPLKIDDALASSHRGLCRQLIELWSFDRHSTDWPIIQLYGSEDVSKLAIAASVCKELDMQAHVMRESDLPTTITERQTLARLWEREAILGSGVLVLDYIEDEGVNNAGRALSFAEGLQGLIILTGRQPLRPQRRAIVRLEVQKPSTAEQRVLWESGLRSMASKLNGQLDALVNQFNLGTSAIRDACADALATPQVQSEPQAIGKVLWQACRGQARPQLGGLAPRIEPEAGWGDLVLPMPQLQILYEVATHVRQRIKVYDTWGFAARGSRGLGISALFSGVSGTGKTMAAEVLARELDLDLYRIDLSSVVSKYIGETEKNLRRVFDAAEAGGAILLFDEADALFGKRSEVKDSHDRYANIEVSYLLQRMEAYRGLAILTTNMKSALDSAFLRRIRFIVQFPFPDANHRAEIWRRIYPQDTPTEALNEIKLAKLNITGGNIRNIALNAAFLAADAGEPVRMSHLLRASRSEYAKLEKPLTDSEVAGWV